MEDLLGQSHTFAGDPQELVALCTNPNPDRNPDKEFRDSCSVNYFFDGKKLIQGNANLREYKIAEGTVVICDNAFNLSRGQYSKKILFPNTVVAIGKHAFSDANVKDVIWSANLKYIGSYAFSGCPWLKSGQELDLPQSLAYIGASAFDSCKSFTSIVFPDSIFKIDSHAFRNCESLKWVYIPDTITGD